MIVTRIQNKMKSDQIGNIVGIEIINWSYDEKLLIMLSPDLGRANRNNLKTMLANDLNIEKD